MIKKVNIALVLVFGLMMLLKLLRQDGAVDTAPEVVFENPVVTEERSALAPRIYYFWTPPFFKIDPLSKRNGFVLDQLQAIFPRAELVRCADFEQQTFDRWREDPRAVICRLEDCEQMAGFPRAVSSPAWISLHVLTPRALPWKYRGPESLKGLRLCAEKGLISSRFVQDLAKKNNLKLEDFETVARDKALKDKMDGGLELVSSDWSLASANTYSFDYENYRRSPPICRFNMALFANNIDTNFSAAVIRDFDVGFKRLCESGERRRICEYYGFQD